MACLVARWILFQKPTPAWSSSLNGPACHPSRCRAWLPSQSCASVHVCTRVSVCVCTCVRLHAHACCRQGKSFWDVTAPLDRSGGGGFPVTPCTRSPHSCLWWRSPRRAGLKCGSRETSAKDWWTSHYIFKFYFSRNLGAKSQYIKIYYPDHFSYFFLLFCWPWPMHVDD